MLAAGDVATVVHDRRTWRRGRFAWGGIAAVLLAYLGTIAFVNPIGDFPLNDDWSYALAVWSLVEHGSWRPTGWTSMPLITQSLWGAAFCLPADCSFTTLRISTLALSVVGVLGMYLLAREAEAPWPVAAAAAAVYGFNPLQYQLSHTFMADPAFSAVAILSALAFLRCLRTYSLSGLAAATGLAIVATLCRQLGLFLPLAFAVALLALRGWRGRWLLRAASPVLACLAALLLFGAWMDATGRTPALYHQKVELLFSFLHEPVRFVRGLAARGLIALLYLGIFSLPVLLVARPVSGMFLTREGRIRAVPTTAAVLTVLGAVAALVLVTGPLPMTGPAEGNVLIRQGLGPLFLYDMQLGLTDHVPELPRAFWLAATALGLLGGGLLAAHASTLACDLAVRTWQGRMGAGNAIQLFFLAALAIYLAPVTAGPFFDRYLVPAVPIALGLAAAYPGTGRRAAPAAAATAASLLLAMALFSVLGTKDYLAWNRARWAVLAELRSGGEVDPRDIDGGFEYNGLYFYDPDYRPQPGQSAWWTRDQERVIAFGPIAGFEIVGERSYRSWLPPAQRKLLVLRPADSR